MGGRLFLSGFLAMWALEEIQLQKVAKDAIYGDISDEFNPFSEFKLCVNKYLLEL